MEQYFLDNRTYVGYCAGASGVARVQPTVQAFTLTCPTETTSTYQLKATGVPAQGMDTQFVYTVDQSGAKTSTGPSGWAGNASCWAVRKSGECT
jgi:type IV pilus assembly protein PilE